MKNRLFLSLAMMSLMVAPLSSCVAKITCISHIDSDNDGKCDHCGQKMEKKQETNISKISVSKMPNKTYYALNEDVDVEGGEITVDYKDGTNSKVISLSDKDVTISKPNMASKGKKLVGVTYGGVSTSYTIEVGDQRFLVTFDLGYAGATAIDSQYVIIQNLATKPEDPTRSGYDFGGWYTDSSYENKFDFASDKIIADTVLYAKWYKKYQVTFDYNYENGEKVVEETYLGKAPELASTPTRTNYVFAGWYHDKDCNQIFNFSEEITSDITLYAKWVSDSVNMYTVKFNENYGTDPKETTSNVAENNVVSRPTDPERANVSTKGHEANNFVFGGWYTDKECKTAFDFNTKITSDLTLYAKWTGRYIFEAEHISFTNDDGTPIQGMGASGGAQGPNMISSPASGSEGINASNGYYVTYLYSPYLTLKFNIDSDRDVDDASLIFRITCERSGFALSGSQSSGTTANGTLISNYTIKCNGDSIDYSTIEITDTTGHEATGGFRPFSDYTLTTSLNLQKGTNVFEFISSNTNGMGGTMAATAPVIDCIKIDTYAELDWNPITSNEFGH